MEGAGCPLTRQDSVTFEPSLASTSELVSESMNVGGTIKQKKQNFIKCGNDVMIKVAKRFQKRKF